MMNMKMSQLSALNGAEYESRCFNITENKFVSEFDYEWVTESGRWITLAIRLAAKASPNDQQTPTFRHGGLHIVGT